MSKVFDAAYEEFSEPDRTRRSRVLSWLAHRVMVLVTLDLVAFLGGLVYRPIWLYWSPFGLLAAVTFLIAYFHQEFGRICVGCMRRVPADAAVRAQKRRWLLWVNHLLSTAPASLLLAVVIGVPFAAKILAREAWQVQLPLWGQLPGELGWCALAWASWTHHKLSPWCPYCKPWDGGGAHEPSPTPDPSGVKTA